MALLFVVLTGFAALTIDAGIGYDTSRNDQDVADAAALAASYWIYQNGSATGSLTGAYTAAEGVANLDCINPAGPCTNAFSLTVYSTYPSSSAVATITSGGCTGSCTLPSSSDLYVGAAVSDTSQKYFAGPMSGGDNTFPVRANAVAEIDNPGGGSGGSGGTQQLLCGGHASILCVLGSGGMSIAGSNFNINTSYSVYVNGSLTCTGSGNMNTGSAKTYIQKAFNNSGCGLNWNPQSANPVTGSAAAVDPLASMTLPTTTATSGCSGTITDTSSTTISPGVYGTLNLSGSNQTVTFNSGTYIFCGGGLSVSGPSVTLNSASGGVVLYFECNSGGAPAGCSSSGQAGAGITISTSSDLNWNLQPEASSSWANVLIIFDRDNTGAIYLTSAAQNIDGSGTGAIYAPDATYNTQASNTNFTLGAPIIVGAFKSSGGNFNMPTIVQVPGGSSPTSPGGLVH
jgi:hypothetical protein